MRGDLPNQVEHSIVVAEVLKALVIMIVVLITERDKTFPEHEGEEGVMSQRGTGQLGG